MAVFTAGRTRAARAYAVGEMLRLSGIHAISGIVVGSDTTDESLGTAPVPDDAVVAAGPGSPNAAAAMAATGADGADPGQSFL